VQPNWNTTPPLLLAAAIAIALVLFGIGLARWWAGIVSRDRNRKAQHGEAEAERILALAGFRVIARQLSARWPVLVDGEVFEVSVRVDLIVERKGKRYVAEVKTGEIAPDPCFPATRRQLLEYSLVFGAAHVLLVDVPARVVRTVAFPELGAA
jgi:hypothetical protein